MNAAVATTSGLVIAAAVIPVVVLVLDGRRSPAPSDSARRALRHVTLASTVATASLGAALASVVTVPFTSAIYLGVPMRVLALVPPAALLVYFAVLAVGELTLPRPTGAVREASVARRSATDVSPAADRRLVAAWACTLVGTATTLALIASGPRSISRVTGRYESFTAGPFPGWLWAVPAIVTVGLTLLAVAGVTRLVAARSALPGVDHAWDLWLRRRVARRVLRSAQLVLGLMVAGLLLVASVGLRTLAGGGDGTYAVPESSAHEIAGWAVTAVAFAVVALALGVALRPARDPAPESSPAPRAAVPQ